MWAHFRCVFIFTFMHLADAFIQSDLQLHSGYTFSLVSVFPGNRTHSLLCCWRNALPLSHTGTCFCLVHATYWIMSNCISFKQLRNNYYCRPYLLHTPNTYTYSTIYCRFQLKWTLKAIKQSCIALHTNYDYGAYYQLIKTYFCMIPYTILLYDRKKTLLP